MSRQRFIHPKIWMSEQVMELSLEARLLFIGLFSTADDAGRRKASPVSIKAEIFPLDSIDLDTIDRLLLEVAGQSLIRLYSDTDGCPIMDIPSWAKYQNPRYKKDSELQEYAEDLRRPDTYLSPKDADLTHICGPGSGSGSGCSSGSGVVVEQPLVDSKKPEPTDVMNPKRIFIDTVIAQWNEWAKANGYATVRNTTKAIRSKVGARFKEPLWSGDYWPAMLEKLNNLRPHWKGESGWKINLEYLVRNDGQAEKLLAGEWSNGDGPPAEKEKPVDWTRKPIGSIPEEFGGSP